MIIQVRELGSREIHGFNTDYISASENLLWVEEENGLPIFIVANIRKLFATKHQKLTGYDHV